ncbi:MAG: FAD:protein FMN transferase [Bacillota bacterium]
MRRRDFLRRAGGGALGLMPAAGLIPRVLMTGRDERLVERWSWVMGQSVVLKVFADTDDQGYEAAAAALAELRRIEARLSVFDDASDLSELNRRAGRPAVSVGADLLAVLQAAARFHRLTAGAFDPAVEPLMRAWGFRQPRAAEPSRRELADAIRAVRECRVTLDGPRASLATAEARLDAGGIAVGYGLDRAAAVLRRHGIGRALLDISGDCLALGAPPGMRGWPVTVVDSARPRRNPRIVHLRDAALATSANTVSAIRYGRTLAGHVMDPLAGRPASALLQATVVARSGIEADALSTALLVSAAPAPGVLEWFSPAPLGARAAPAIGGGGTAAVSSEHSPTN